MIDADLSGVVELDRVAGRDRQDRRRRRLDVDRSGDDVRDRRQRPGRVRGDSPGAIFDCVPACAVPGRRETRCVIEAPPTPGA